METCKKKIPLTNHSIVVVCAWSHRCKRNNIYLVEKTNMTKNMVLKFVNSIKRVLCSTTLKYTTTGWEQQNAHTHTLTISHNNWAIDIDSGTKQKRIQINTKCWCEICCVVFLFDTEKYIYIYHKTFRRFVVINWHRCYLFEKQIPKKMRTKYTDWKFVELSRHKIRNCICFAWCCWCCFYY